jgi:hypothetical protein
MGIHFNEDDIASFPTTLFDTYGFVGPRDRRGILSYRWSERAPAPHKMVCPFHADG